MKAKKLLSIIGLGLFAAVSAGAGLALAQNASSNEVKAESPASDITQYVSVADCNDFWGGGADWPLNVYVCGGLDDGSHDDYWADDVTHLGGDMFSFTLKSGYSKFVVEKSVGGTHWAGGQSFDIEYSSDYNCYSLYMEGGQTKYSYNRYWVTYSNTSDSRTFYVDLSDQASYWYDSSAKTYLYCIGNGADAYVMTRLGNSNVFYCTTNTHYLYKFLIVRSASFDPSDWSTVWNQTKDVILTPTNENCKWIKLGSADAGDGNKLNVAGFEVTTVESFATAFSSQFLLTPLCNDAGGLDEDFETNWDTLSGAATSLNNKSYNVTHTQMISGYLTTASSSGDTPIARAMNRYDTILAKNPAAGISNFLSRSIPSLSSVRPTLFGNEVDNTAAIGIIVIIAISSISIIAVLVAYKKRKHI